MSDVTASKLLKDTAGQANAMQAAQLKMVNARANIWHCLSVLVLVITVGSLIPLTIALIKLAQVAWAWNP